MTSNLLPLIPLTIIIPLISIILVNHHLLSALLNLEATMLSMIMFTIYLMFNMAAMDSVNLLILLTMGACEASLGLTLLSMMSRSQGTDNLTTISAPSC